MKQLIFYKTSLPSLLSLHGFITFIDAKPPRVTTHRLGSPYFWKQNLFAHPQRFWESAAIFRTHERRRKVFTPKSCQSRFSLETNLAGRWEGVRLTRASGKSPDFPGSSPNFPGSFSATSPEVLSLWNLTAIQGCPGSFPDFH